MLHYHFHFFLVSQVGFFGNHFISIIFGHVLGRMIKFSYLEKILTSIVNKPNLNILLEHTMFKFEGSSFND